MVIRTFEGEDMQDVLRKVKKELGTEAVILGSQTRRTSGASRERVVVTAGLPGIDPPWLGGGEAQNGPVSSSDTETRRLREEVATLRDTVLRFEKEWGSGTRDKVMELVRTVGTLSEEAREHTSSGAPEEMGVASGLLDRAGVTGEERDDLLKALRSVSYSPVEFQDPERTGSLLQYLMSRQIRVGGSFLERSTDKGSLVVILAGPTGVGKTTTIAKLAAGFTLKHGKKVRLINLDTYRIGALEQLRIYGDLMGLPVDVAGTPDRFLELLDIGAVSPDEVVLVDTAGMSSRETEKLKPFVDGVLAKSHLDVTVSLVLAASAKAADLEDALERFMPLSPRSLIVTKLDETRCLGSVYPFLSRSPVPVSYVTTGQRVPDDIEVAHPGKLSQWILGGFR
jgi:flagellar biosynthesis protein FlhF